MCHANCVEVKNINYKKHKVLLLYLLLLHDACLLLLLGEYGPFEMVSVSVAVAAKWQLYNGKSQGMLLPQRARVLEPLSGAVVLCLCMCGSVLGGDKLGLSGCICMMDFVLREKIHSHSRCIHDMVI